MEPISISNMLIKNWDAGYRDFGVSVETLADKEDAWVVDNPYFFLRKELAVAPEEWKAAKAAGNIRHCIVNKGKFLDYIVNKEFDTFEAWVADAGGAMSDVMYGANRIHILVKRKGKYVPKRARYVRMKTLLTVLKYKEHFKTELDEDGYPLRITRDDINDWEDIMPHIGSTIIHHTA